MRFINWLLRRKPAPVEVRPNRAARRAYLRMKPGEYRARFEASALKKAKRKAARGYRGDHVRTREVYQSGVQRGIDMTLAAMQRRLKDRGQRRKWLPRIVSRIPKAA